MSPKQKNASESKIEGKKTMVLITAPDGTKKNHGYIENGTFYRNVTEKDRMRIFDAWSINPKVLNKLMRENVKHIEYRTPDSVYTISFADMWDWGFTREFSGGLTHYIPLKHWHKTARKVIKRKKTGTFKSYSHA